MKGVWDWEFEQVLYIATSTGSDLVINILFQNLNFGKQYQSKNYDNVTRRKIYECEVYMFVCCCLAGIVAGDSAL
jgi:hypothetical protein